jgi:DNA-binding NarL/FixJ family response regulator
MAEAEKPLLIVMDLSMQGGVDGITAAEKIIRKSPDVRTWKDKACSPPP